ncbi:cytokine receptor-like factor 2 [Nomascus leucogenys]|uniref:cytokine receptor-like factor 2 n=1 Tax=Nomascus leucogenys TaxID=61853 RepID=UPI00122D6A2F|nr:cytokine receptor-like factor 2 [Nomascus leucogenys]
MRSACHNQLREEGCRFCYLFFPVKPSFPKHVSFSWHQDAVTVMCSDLSYGDLLYEVQYRSPFDMEWQSKQENTCNVTIESLDAKKCYSFQVRVKAMGDAYGPDTYPSDWSEMTCWQRGEIRDSCAETPTPPKPKLSKFILISSLAILLMVSLLLLSLWKLWRVKKFLMPSVPDPKSIFPGLFEIHQGNFQENGNAAAPWARPARAGAPSLCFPAAAGCRRRLRKLTWVRGVQRLPQQARDAARAKARLCAGWLFPESHQGGRGRPGLRQGQASGPHTVCGDARLGGLCHSRPWQLLANPPCPSGSRRARCASGSKG